MIRYNYIPYGSQSAPFVHVTLRCPHTASQTEEIPAQIDTGADRSVLPGPVARGLGLVQMGAISVAGFGGTVTTVPTFAVEIALRSFDSLLVKVIASEGEGITILGRDVLNRFRIVLDGPQAAVEIG